MLKMTLLEAFAELPNPRILAAADDDYRIKILKTAIMATVTGIGDRVNEKNPTPLHVEVFIGLNRAPPQISTMSHNNETHCTVTFRKRSTGELRKMNCHNGRQAPS